MKAGFNRVIIKEIKDENTNGLYLGSSTPDGITRGTIVDVNLDKDTVMDIKVNDVVQFKTAFSSLVKINDEEYHSLSVRDILVIE